MRKIVAVVVALAALGLAGTASAYPTLAFTRATVAPGDRISLYTADAAARSEPFLSNEGGLRYVVYLVPASLGHKLDRKRTYSGRRVALVGELEADKLGVGRLTFRVPNLPPGLYAARMWCSGCGSFLPEHVPVNAVAGLGRLRITAAPATAGRRTATAPAAAAGAVALFALGLGVKRRRATAA